jgi:predicted dehydrogenase
MSQTVRVGVVGVGYLGRIHAKIYAAMPGVELVGVADTDAAARDAVAALYGCKPFACAEDMIGKVDAVSIVVPTVHHLATARPFLAAGTHMLMEKPLAPTLDEARELVALAERAGKVFQVGHLERFNAGMMELARRVVAPRFIEVHRIGSFVERATDVDVVTDLMIHDIDIVLDLVRRPIRSVAATGVPVMTDHVDIANARLEFEGGAVANVTASRVSTKKQRRIRVFAHNAYYALDFVDQQVEVAEAIPAPGGGRPEIRHEKLAIEPTPPLDAELAAFIECVRTGATPLVTGAAGLEALRVAMLVKEKMQACLKP